MRGASLLAMTMLLCLILYNSYEIVEVMDTKRDISIIREEIQGIDSEISNYTRMKEDEMEEVKLLLSEINESIKEAKSLREEILSLRDGKIKEVEKGKIAILRIDEDITPEKVTEYIKSLREMRFDDSKAVVLWIDSWGASSNSDVFLGDYIMELRAWKPVVVYSGGGIWGGGYNAAIYSDRVIVNEHASVGWLGPLLRHIDYSEYWKKEGIEVTVFKAGKHKDMFWATRPLDSEEEEMYYNWLMADELYISTNLLDRRGIDLNRARELESGEFWSSEEALDLGLIDELGGLNRAIEVAAELAKVKEPEPIFIRPGEWIKEPEED